MIILFQYLPLKGRLIINTLFVLSCTCAGHREIVNLHYGFDVLCPGGILMDERRQFFDGQQLGDRSI